MWSKRRGGERVRCGHSGGSVNIEQKKGLRRKRRRVVVGEDTEESKEWRRKIMRAGNRWDILRKE